MNYIPLIALFLSSVTSISLPMSMTLDKAKEEQKNKNKKAKTKTESDSSDSKSETKKEPLIDSDTKKESISKSDTSKVYKPRDYKKEQKDLGKTDEEYRQLLQEEMDREDEEERLEAQQKKEKESKNKPHTCEYCEDEPIIITDGECFPKRVIRPKIKRGWPYDDEDYYEYISFKNRQSNIETSYPLTFYVGKSCYPDKRLQKLIAKKSPPHRSYLFSKVLDLHYVNKPEPLDKPSVYKVLIDSLASAQKFNNTNCGVPEVKTNATYSQEKIGQEIAESKIALLRLRASRDVPEEIVRKLQELCNLLEKNAAIALESKENNTPSSNILSRGYSFVGKRINRWLSSIFTAPALPLRIFKMREAALTNRAAEIKNRAAKEHSVFRKFYGLKFVSSESNEPIYIEQAPQVTLPEHHYFTTEQYNLIKQEIIKQTLDQIRPLKVKTVRTLISALSLDKQITTPSTLVQINPVLKELLQAYKENKAAFDNNETILNKALAYFNLDFSSIEAIKTEEALARFFTLELVNDRLIPYIKAMETIYPGDLIILVRNLAHARDQLITINALTKSTQAEIEKDIAIFTKLAQECKDTEELYSITQEIMALEYLNTATNKLIAENNVTSILYEDVMQLAYHTQYTHKKKLRDTTTNIVLTTGTVAVLAHGGLVHLKKIDKDHKDYLESLQNRQVTLLPFDLTSRSGKTFEKVVQNYAQAKKISKERRDRVSVLVAHFEQQYLTRTVTQPAFIKTNHHLFLDALQKELELTRNLLSKEEKEKVENRLAALKETIKIQDTKTKLVLDQNKTTAFILNPFQQLLHKENQDLLEKINALRTKDLPQKIYINPAAEYLEAAAIANIKGDTQRALALTDAANALLDKAQSQQAPIKTNKELSDIIEKVLSDQGVTGEHEIKALKRLGSLVYNDILALYNDPQGTVINVVATMIGSISDTLDHIQDYASPLSINLAWNENTETVKVDFGNFDQFKSRLNKDRQAIAEVAEKLKTMKPDEVADVIVDMVYGIHKATLIGHTIDSTVKTAKTLAKTVLNPEITLVKGSLEVPISKLAKCTPTPNSIRIFERQQRRIQKLLEDSETKHLAAILEKHGLTIEELINLSTEFDGKISLKLFSDSLPDKLIVFDFSHFFTPDLRKNRKGIVVSGGHLMTESLLNCEFFVIKKNDLYKLPGGFEVFDIAVKGYESILKPTFPRDWSKEKIMSKIMESIKNGTATIGKDGKIEIVGRISEGIEICSEINATTGEVLTSFPVLFGRK